MERVGILINKLQEQLSQNAGARNLLVTTQMLQAELMQAMSAQPPEPSVGVNIMVPFTPANEVSSEPANGNILVEQQQKSEKISAPQAPVAPPEKRPVETVQNDVAPQHPPGWSVSPVEVPTLAHQEKIALELNDTMLTEVGSLNESLKENKSEIASVLKEAPIKDLKRAISINDRHRFIHDLFRDDETMYERSIKTINGFYIYAEAEYWIQRELKLKLGWDSNSEVVKSFDQLVKRRFS